VKTIGVRKKKFDVLLYGLLGFFDVAKERFSDMAVLLGQEIS
jgi:hypothetical protein